MRIYWALCIIYESWLVRGRSGPFSRRQTIKPGQRNGEKFFVASVAFVSRKQGGLKAVVWTDSLQVGVMIIAVITVSSLGTWQLGGPAIIWQKAQEAHRIQFFK